jgi:hypothetical protein
VPKIFDPGEGRRLPVACLHAVQGIGVALPTPTPLGKNANGAHLALPVFELSRISQRRKKWLLEYIIFKNQRAVYPRDYRASNVRSCSHSGGGRFADSHWI